MSPSRRREAIDQVRRVLPISERRACRVLGQHRSTQRYSPRNDAEEQRLTEDIIALAKDYGRYGVEEAPFLSPMDRIIGGVEIEDDLPGRLLCASRISVTNSSSIACGSWLI